MRLTGIGCMLLAVALFGTLGPAERVAFKYGVTPEGVTVVRAVFGFLVVAVFAIFKDPSALVPGWKDLWKYIGAGLFGVVFVFYLSNIAFVTIPVGLTVILFYTNPFWTVMGATFLGYERFTLRRLVALFAGFAGVWIAVGGVGGGDYSVWGMTCAVVSGVGYSVYMLNSRYGTGRTSPFKTFVQMFLWGAVMMTGIALYTGDMPVLLELPASALLALAHLAIFPTTVSYALVSLALSMIPGVVASITSMAEIIFATGFAWVFLGERLAFHQVAGGLFIASAVLMLILEKGSAETVVREGA